MPFDAIPSLYPGYRAAHYRAGMASFTSEAASGWSSSSRRSTEIVAGAGDAIAVGGSQMPPESCCFCLPGLRGLPPIPLYTDSPAERAFLIAAVRGAQLARPMMPFPPLYAGSLFLELESLYWSNCYALLLPAHLLILHSSESPWPHRVLPLSSAIAYHRAGDSLVISLHTEQWQVRQPFEGAP